MTGISFPRKDSLLHQVPADECGDCIFGCLEGLFITIGKIVVAVFSVFKYLCCCCLCCNEDPTEPMNLRQTEYLPAPIQIREIQIHQVSWMNPHSKTPIYRVVEQPHPENLVPVSIDSNCQSNEAPSYTDSKLHDDLPPPYFLDTEAHNYEAIVENYCQSMMSDEDLQCLAKASGDREEESVIAEAIRRRARSRAVQDLPPPYSVQPSSPSVSAE